MAKVVLLANERCAPEVAQHLWESGDEVIRMYISKHGRGNGASIEASRLPAEKIFFANSLKEPRHLAELKQLDFDFIITVQWLYLLKPEIYQLAKKGTINFHPALLPRGRGWYPHVHSIIRKNPAGVTLHAIDDGADTGPIWAQKEIEIRSYDQAKDVYLRQQDAMIDLFRETWTDIRDGRIQPKPQDHEKAVYFDKSEVAPYDELDLNKSMKVSEVLDLLRARSFGDLLRARSFGDRGFAYYEEDGRRVYVNLRFTVQDKP